MSSFPVPDSPVINTVMLPVGYTKDAKLKRADRLAAEGLCFKYAHVQVGNCMPSRNVMWSGRYPHNNRVEGFYQVKDPGYPVLADLMKQAGLDPGGYTSKFHLPLDPKLPSGQAVRRILGHLLGVMTLNEEGVKADTDTEFLHDYRVAIRRIRSALVVALDDGELPVTEVGQLGEPDPR